MRTVSSLVTLAAAVAILALGIWKGTFSAGDGDAFGYVSQSALLAKGTLRIEQQFQRSMPWPYAEWSFAPAGYRPAIDRGFIVPTYPPGLPLVMAAFRRVAGAGAVFFVVPVMGALCVWMTGDLGARVHGPLAGMIAALVLASSPSFLYQLMQPLSDVPATAWWAIALALALRESRGACLGAGVAASMAVLTRPNLVPLAAVIGVFLTWQAVRASHDGRRQAVQRIVLFAAGAAPGGVAVAAVQNYLYGSPLRSGYEEFDALFAWANAWPNVKQYPRWLIETQTPAVCLALAAPWFARSRDRVWLLLAWVAVVFLCYVFYVPFGRDEWSYLRFLLPAYPPLIVLSVTVALELIRRLTARDGIRLTAALLLCAALVAWQGREAYHRGAFTQRAIEQRYEDVGRYVANILPANAVFIAGLHAGSIRYYSERLTIRFDWVGERRLDQVVDVMREKGYHPYIALEEGEEPGFRERFAARSDLARLDWPPAAQRSQPIRVRIYDPLDRARAAQGGAVTTAEIAVRHRR
jgi:hypothetical protein